MEYTECYRPRLPPSYNQRRGGRKSNLLLRNSKCKDAFHLDTMLIKNHSDTLAPPIAHLINLSIATFLKHAIVTI